MIQQHLQQLHAPVSAYRPKSFFLTYSCPRDGPTIDAFDITGIGSDTVVIFQGRHTHQRQFLVLPLTSPMILNITAFEERPGIAVILPMKFNFLSFFGFTLIQRVATYAPCTPTGVSDLVTMRPPSVSAQDFYNPEVTECGVICQCIPVPPPDNRYAYSTLYTIIQSRPNF